MLTCLNIEDNKAMETRWLSELVMKLKMEMVCVSSLKENQTNYDYASCGKLMVGELDELCKSDVELRYPSKSQNGCIGEGAAEEVHRDHLLMIQNIIID